MRTVIKVENLSKQYRLGQVSTGALAHDVNRWWYKFRGKEDPYLKISEVNDRTQKGNSEYVWALQDINFDVKQGEVLGIIGRNGAGKSTLLKILSRTTAPTTGSIKIKGRVASLLEVGTGFHPELSGRENVFLNGAIMGMTKKEIKRKFDEIVAFAGVERYIDTPVKRYSSGMYVRLAFAVAAHLEPEILIIDEVLAVGDAEFQKKCLGKMKDVSVNEGRTVLFVSHNMAAVSSLCTQSLFMSNGQVQDFGDTKKIIDKYITFGRESTGEITTEQITYTRESSVAFFNTIRLVSNNIATNVIRINDEVLIELEYSIAEDDVLVYPSIHILDNMGTVILATFNGNSATFMRDDFFGKKLKRGKYKSTCKIPSNFFNTTIYSVSAFLVPEASNDSAIAENVLRFSVEETGEMRKEYVGEWIGLIRPKLAWNTSYLNT